MAATAPDLCYAIIIMLRGAAHFAFVYVGLVGGVRAEKSRQPWNSARGTIELFSPQSHGPRSSCRVSTCFKSLLSSLDNQLMLSFVYAPLQVFQFVIRIDVDVLRYDGRTTI